jgi:hypothetical protein
MISGLVHVILLTIALVAIWPAFIMWFGLGELAKRGEPLSEDESFGLIILALAVQLAYIVGVVYLIAVRSGGAYG